MRLLIEGHTDATPYSSDASYSNWELSADRANAARRLLQQDGVRADQVTQVRGYADQMLRVKTNPYDPSNRRISILVKNEGGTPASDSCAEGGDAAGREAGGGGGQAVSAKKAIWSHKERRGSVSSPGVFACNRVEVRSRSAGRTAYGEAR